VILGAAVALAVAAPAGAQGRSPLTQRIFISVNGGVQQAPSDASDRFEFDEHVETATVDVTYPYKANPAFDGGIGVRVWRRFGAGFAFSRFSGDTEAQVRGSIPHPFFFDQPREIEGTASGLTRSETALHAQVFYVLPLAGRLQAIVSAGPSRIEAEQGVVRDLQYDEEFPFDTATFRSASTRGAKASAIGFNVGADVAYMFTRRLGVGGLLRFSRATVDLDAGGGRSVSVDVGGLQGGGGIRLVF
jgi:hypothetical protein